LEDCVSLFFPFSLDLFLFFFKRGLQWARLPRFLKVRDVSLFQSFSSVFLIASFKQDSMLNRIGPFLPPLSFRPDPDLRPPLHGLFKSRLSRLRGYSFFSYTGIRSPSSCTLLFLVGSLLFFFLFFLSRSISTLSSPYHWACPPPGGFEFLFIHFHSPNFCVH